jgi:4-amino-4-deoxy-L-arabinose transferase-like glycosyltransferase
MSVPQSRWLSLPERPNAIAALILGFTLLRLLFAATVPLMPQEAYYWQWSRHLDWSYFDHPPMVAYGIALTTAVFGQNAFAVKLAAVLWALGWNLLWARLILDMFGSRRLAFWSLLALNLTLVYQVHGAGPTPDTPLILGWVGVVWAVWRASASGQGGWWLVAGMFGGLAMLSKYSALLLLPVVLLYLLFSPQQRHWLRSPGPYLAVAIAALMFAPVVWWNAQHDWVSFAFQSSRRVGQMASFKPRNFLHLVGTQMLMVTPYLLVLAIAAMLRGLRDGFTGRLDDRMRLLLISGALPVILFSLVSFRSVVKLNWLAPAYWSLIVLAMHHLLQRANDMRRVALGLASSAALVLLMFIVLAVPNLPLGNSNTWSGWQDAADAAERVAQPLRDQGVRTFVFAPNYKTSSLLRFYLPGQPRTYAQDIFGRHALQYDYFPLADDLKGATGILVRSDHRQNRLDTKQLEAWFDACERADVVETKGFGRVARRVEIYRCSNYKGHPQIDLATGGNDNPEEDGE